MAWPTASVSGLNTGTPEAKASPSVSGANTFSSLKAMFKPVLAQKKCKTCGAMFTPKTPAAPKPVI